MPLSLIFCLSILLLRCFTPKKLVPGFKSIFHFFLTLVKYLNHFLLCTLLFARLYYQLYVIYSLLVRCKIQFFNNKQMRLWDKCLISRQILTRKKYTVRKIRGHKLPKQLLVSTLHFVERAKIEHISTVMMVCH